MKKQTILFMITNGAGLGHLTRGLAVAKRLRALSSQYEIIFFTTSLATEVIRREGFMHFYLPTKSLLPETLSMPEWMEILYRQLEDCVRIYQPSLLVFDGAMPYSALVSQINKHRYMKSVWIKRENYKQGWQGLNVYEEHFDKVIIPDEIGDPYVEGPEKSRKRIHCQPISFLDTEEAHEREQVRASLGVKANEKLYYVQLGAGMLNDIERPLEAVQKELAMRKNTKVLLGESIIGKPVKSIAPNIQVIRSYPNAQYFKGIDFAISAAGYNTFHELVQFGVPTLFMPNPYTVVDDQVKRVRNLEEKQAALMVMKLAELPGKIGELEENQKKMIKQLKNYKGANGALEAAKIIAHELN